MTTTTIGKPCPDGVAWCDFHEVDGSGAVQHYGTATVDAGPLSVSLVREEPVDSAADNRPVYLFSQACRSLFGEALTADEALRLGVALIDFARQAVDAARPKVPA